ncbi:hypothetical protein J6590_043994 [Homalodisca vitripennis]|nr:hypothetical protein J6590_043994 [Homalodisca vitripennis]
MTHTLGQSLAIQRPYTYSRPHVDNRRAHPSARHDTQHTTRTRSFYNTSSLRQIGAITPHNVLATHQVTMAAAAWQERHPDQRPCVIGARTNLGLTSLLTHADPVSGLPQDTAGQCRSGPDPSLSQYHHNG